MPNVLRSVDSQDEQLLLLDIKTLLSTMPMMSDRQKFSEKLIKLLLEENAIAHHEVAEIAESGNIQHLKYNHE